MVRTMDVRAYLAVFFGAALLAGSGICSGADPQVLLISVLQTDDVELARTLLANSSAVEVKGPGFQTSTRNYGTDSLRSESIQQVQVIEGQAAHFSTIYRSQEVRFLWAKDTRRGVVPNVDLVAQESVSGFYAKAELQGNDVLLHMDQYNGQSWPEYSGYGLNQNVRTTVYGHLGDWLDAGGLLDLDLERPVNRVYTLQHKHEGQTRLLVKVELAPK